MNTSWSTYTDFKLFSHSQVCLGNTITWSSHTRNAAIGLKLPLQFAGEHCDSLQSSKTDKKLNELPVSCSAPVDHWGLSAQ